MNKKNYKNYLADLREVLNEHDPIRLIAIGAPEDEYDLERGVIAARPAHCRSVDDVHSMVYDVFCEYFDAGTAGSRDAYRPLAEHLWNAATKWSTPHS
jgi:hypothetical protein